MLLTDKQIWDLAVMQDMITPFEIDCIREVPITYDALDIDLGKMEPTRKVVSFGLSSMGYDLRLASKVEMCTPGSEALDPKRDNSQYWKELKLYQSSQGEYVQLPPFSVAIASAIETIKVPDDVLVLVANKSTHARDGSSHPFVVYEPGWRGIPTFSLRNNAPRPRNWYIGEGVVQLLFLKASDRAGVTYQQRLGKYQNQTQITYSVV